MMNYNTTKIKMLKVYNAIFPYNCLFELTKVPILIVSAKRAFTRLHRVSHPAYCRDKQESRTFSHLFPHLPAESLI